MVFVPGLCSVLCVCLFTTMHVSVLCFSAVHGSVADLWIAGGRRRFSCVQIQGGGLRPERTWKGVLPNQVVYVFQMSFFMFPLL